MITIPTLPPEGAGTATGTPWYPHYAGLDGALRELQGIVAGLVAPSGLVFSVAGVTPDSGGNVVLAASDVNAMAAGYAPSFADMPSGTAIFVYKDTSGGATNGFWPASWTGSTAVYTGGATNHAVRPHARADCPVIWVGADPSPDSVLSGTGGMLRGVDQRAIPVP